MRLYKYSAHGMKMEFKHVSVLLDESVDGLALKENSVFVDATLGGGGHSYRVLENYKNCKLIGIDQDENAILAATDRLLPFGDRVQIVRDNFKNIRNVLSGLGIEKIDGAIMDLGVSSHQLDEVERGFSYMNDARLDMRMDNRAALTAYDIINHYPEQKLANIIFEYGEDKFSRKIAARIVERREQKPIETTLQLVEAITSIVHGTKNDGHPAKRTFQAIRIEVNGELAILKQAIEDFCDVLSSGGRLCIITFHSLEDRIVKNTFRDLGIACTCPKDFPICVCSGQAIAKVITRKPILPLGEEIEENSRSKSAKLRILEKL